MTAPDVSVIPVVRQSPKIPVTKRTRPNVCFRALKGSNGAGFALTGPIRSGRLAQKNVKSLGFESFSEGSRDR